MRMNVGRFAKPALLWQLPAGLLAGMSLVYFWDRAQGQGRRQHVQKLVNHWIDQGRERALHKEAHSVPEENDATLLQRVQSEIFRDSSLLRDVLNVESQAGIITLRGTIDEPARMLALIAAVQDVSGVIEVRNLLHLPATPAPNKAPSLVASNAEPDQTPATQPIPATPQDAALAGADLAAGTLADVPQPAHYMRSGSVPAMRAKAAPAGETSKTRAAKRQASRVVAEKSKSRAEIEHHASEKKRTASSKNTRNASRTSATQKGQTMQPNSDQDPFTPQKPTPDENVDFSELVTPEMSEAVRAQSPQHGDQRSSQAAGWDAQANQSDADSIQPAIGNDSGLPGGGVGRREAPGKTGIYPLSASEGANPDSPLQSEGAFGQGDRGIKGYKDTGDSEIMLGNDEQAEQGNAQP